MSHTAELEDRLRQLALGLGVNVKSSKSGGVKDSNGKIESRRVRGSSGLPFEGELKSILKEISNINWQDVPETGDNFKRLVGDTLKSYEQDIASHDDEQHDLGTLHIHDKITSALVVLKAVAETPNPKRELEFITARAENGNENEITRRFDPFWDMTIDPNLRDIYDYLCQVFRYCHKNLKNYSRNSAEGSGDIVVTSSSAGFVRYQILGLLQKGVRTLLVFLRRGFTNLQASNGTEYQNWRKANTCVESLGDTLCDLLNSDADVGLDIRCSIGLAITDLTLYRLKGWNTDVVSYFETIFKASAVSSSSSADGKDKDVLLENVKRTTIQDVNRIGLAIGILCSMDFEEFDVDLSDLIFLIAKNVLDLDHGTKEALNLGTARVLEMLTEKLANPRTPTKILEKVFTLFGTLEFFVFSYIPGHIDAVKNCCRNTLGSLARVYQRIQEQQLQFCNSMDLIQDLLRKILSKDPHVKWIGLSCVTKNSSASIKVLELDKNLPVTLLCAKRSCKNSASDSYISLMSYDFLLLDRHLWEQRWIIPLFVTQPNQNYESWGQKKIIIKSILKSPKTVTSRQMMLQPLLKFVIHRMNSTQSEKEITESTMLAAETIKIASELGLKIDLETTLESEDSFRGLIPRNVLNSWLWHENPQIRLAGSSLLVETKKTSEVILRDDFVSIKILLKYNLVSQNPAFRQEFVSYFKKLIGRIKDSQALLKRKNDTSHLKDYEEFLVWMWNFFTNDEGLFTGANFGRRCQSLECLSELVVTFGDFTIFEVLPDNSNLKYLSWLVDSYENNKTRALKILLKMPIPAFQDEKTCKSIFEEALSLCESVKPPDSTTGRFLMVLLMKKTKIPTYSPANILNFLLEKLVQTHACIIATSLTEVSCERPMYGVIRCIRMILSVMDDYHTEHQLYRRYFEKLMSLLLKYVDILFPLLGNAAPEGLLLPGLPDSAEENSQVVRSITAQMLLVCSWRSMRDICLLFADMCLILPLEGEKPKKPHSSGEFILSFDQVSSIGDHMLHLLKNLVHRGVFEQVFVGFKTLATRLWESSNPNLCALPSRWLTEAMNEEHMSSKCITRRSAGLPFIFQALLSAECDNSMFIGDWVMRLFVRDESPMNSTVRIHAMNVLRGLFKDANFSSAMMPFVPDGLRVAFRGLKSEDWTERNAGLMLYGALIRRTFGPKLNLMSAPTFFRRFPQMYDFLLGELDVCLKLLNISTSACHVKGQHQLFIDEDSTNCSDFTFHLLLLLSSFAPAGRVEDEHFKLSDFIVKLRQCAACPDMEVRKLAAKAIIPFLNSPNDYSVMLNIVAEMLESGISKLSLNHVHGNLIQMSIILKYITRDKCTEIIIKALSDLLTAEYFSSINCPTIFEGIAEVILAFENFEHPNLQLFCKTLTDIYYTRFDTSIITNRNEIPGLLSSDATVSRGEILFTLSPIVYSERSLLETIYHWLSAYRNLVFLEQLMEYLCDVTNQEIFNRIFNVSKVLLHALISCYLNANIKYIGQSELELKFLELLTKVNDSAYENCLKSEEIHGVTANLLDRLFDICTSSSATTEHKRLALISLCKLTFKTGIEIKQEQQDLLCLILIEWTGFSVDDDLRFGAALGVPRVPLNGAPLQLSVINQCKMWLSMFNLAQDDDPEIRSIIHSKVSYSDMMTCDRKSLENLVSCFFENVVKFYPLEGITVLLGMLFKDDFEVKTEDTNDDEEGRLFDKSEMNMFNEPIILAKVIKRYIVRQSLSKSFQTCFEKVLTPELSELYELASNTKLYICSPTLSTILNLVSMRLNSDKICEAENKSSVCDSFCLVEASTMHAVQSTVLKIVTEAFL